MENKEQVVDGDKLLAFIDAIKNLGVLLEQTQIGSFKDAFIVGKQVGSIERILEIKKEWNVSFGEMAKAMEEDLSQIRKSRKECDGMVSMLRTLSNVGQSPQYKATHNQLKELVDLLDRLKKHQESGTLEILCKIAK